MLQEPLLPELVMKIGPLENKPPANPAAGERLSSMLADAGSAFDAEKVARISQAIRDGRFSVDAGAIADRLIASAGGMLGKPAH